MADLITVQEYKDAEGMRGDNNDDRLAILVPQVSDLLKSIVGQVLLIIIHLQKQKHLILLIIILQ